MYHKFISGKILARKKERAMQIPWDVQWTGFSTRLNNDATRRKQNRQEMPRIPTTTVSAASWYWAPRLTLTTSSTFRNCRASNLLLTRSSAISSCQASSLLLTTVSAISSCRAPSLHLATWSEIISCRVSSLPLTTVSAISYCSSQISQMRCHHVARMFFNERISFRLKVPIWIGKWWQYVTKTRSMKG